VHAGRLVAVDGGEQERGRRRLAARRGRKVERDDGASEDGGADEVLRAQECSSDLPMIVAMP
jgi:hypothetical protein